MSSIAPTVPKVAVPGTGTGAAMAQKGLDTAKQGVSKMKEAFSKAGPVAIFILVVILVFVIVIIYITFALKNSYLTGKLLTTQPIKILVPIFLNL